MSSITQADTEKYHDIKSTIEFIQARYGCRIVTSSIYRAIKSKKLKGYRPFKKLLIKEVDILAYWDSCCTEKKEG